MPKPKAPRPATPIERALFAHMKRKGLSQARAAKALKVHVNTIINWKCGTSASEQNRAKIQRLLKRAA